MLPVIDGSIQATVGIPEHRTLTRRASKQQRGRQVDFHPTGRPLAVISSVCGNNWCKNGVKRVFEGEKIQCLQRITGLCADIAPRR